MILKDGMLLYHGSYTPVKRIDLGMCSDAKDFGKGFYLTSDLLQARSFVKSSVLKAKRHGAVAMDQYCFLTDKAIQCLEFQEARKYVG